MRTFSILCMSVVLIWASPVIPRELYKIQSFPLRDNPEEMLEQGARMIINALKLVLKTIPQYELPEVLDNGDIIIRRVQKKKDKKDFSKKI